MQQINLNKLKRDCLIAVLIPSALLGLFQVTFEEFSMTTIILLASVSAAMILAYLYRFFTRLEDMTWQQQLSCVIQKVTTPVIIADHKHEISYANDSFQRLPLATLLSQSKNIVELLATQENIESSEREKRLAQFKTTLETLSGRMKSQITWVECQYEWIVMPLYSPAGKRWGTLLEFSIKNQQNSDLNTANEALAQSSHPLVVLDKDFQVQRATTAFKQLLNKSAHHQVNHQLESINFLDHVIEAFPKVALCLKQTLESNKSSSFIAEHCDRICDWKVTPIKSQQQVFGYLIEVIYPSLQEMMALEEGLERAQHRQNLLERELIDFTQGLGKLALYQKEPNVVLEQFKHIQFNHPLLRNSAKIVQKLQNEMQNVKDTPSPMFTPNGQINILSTSIMGSVHEIDQDFSGLNQELMKLNSHIKEQKELNQAYAKPVSRTIQSTEEALFKTVGYSESVTMIMQQLHENQADLHQLQEFVKKLGKFTGTSSAESANKIYQDIIGFLDSVKLALNTSKQNLAELLSDFDSLKGCSNVALQGLKSCLELNMIIDKGQAKGNVLGSAIHEYSQHVHQRVQHLKELAQKLQTKTHQPGFYAEPVQESTCMYFEQMAIEVDDPKKRKAEDVLLEGLRRA